MNFGVVDVNTLLDAVIVVGGLFTSRKLAANQNHIKDKQQEIHELVNSNLTNVTNQLVAVNKELLEVKSDAVEQIAALRSETLNLRELFLRQGGAPNALPPISVPTDPKGA